MLMGRIWAGKNGKKIGKNIKQRGFANGHPPEYGRAALFSQLSNLCRLKEIRR